LFLVLFIALSCCQNNDIGYFWQFTDLHLSPAYKEGTSRLHYCQKGKGFAGKYGDISKCDTPQVTMDSAFEEMLKINPKPDFVLYSGDMAPHKPQGDETEITKEDVLGYEHNVTLLLNKYFPDTPCYPIFGNHDTYPRFTVYFQESYWLFKELANEWKQFYSEQALKTIAKGGYFSEEILPGLLLLSINTNLYYRENTAHDPTVPDPIDQLAFLNETFYNAKINKKKILVHYHVPMGFTGEFIGEIQEPRNDQLADVMAPYHDIIIGQLAGHNHIDSFHIISGNNSSSALFLCPSVNEYMFT